VVVHVPVSVECAFDGDEDDEEEEDGVFDEVEDEVPPCWALPAGIAGAEKAHGGDGFVVGLKMRIDVRKDV
jgi:hypothetical protein